MLIDSALQNYDKKNATDGYLSSYTLNEKGNKVYGQDKAEVSNYQPDDDVKAITSVVLDSFRWSDVIMRKPRRELNDYSVLTRTMYDQMAFNTYQPNNGQAPEGDPSEAWKSNAVRPVIRNKVMSIAAHATSRLLFPKIYAYNDQSDSQDKAAKVMRDLVEWASEQNEYQRMTLYAIINALVSPVSIMHMEYAEAYRTVKKEKKDGKWVKEEILDEDYSGFKMTPVAVDELYVADFYTEDIQKQYYVIWRRVQTFDAMKRKYGDLENFKYVKAGIQILYNDANVAFYEVYDSNLRQSMCEEVIFYCKALDLQLIFVNGILLSDPDQPNPRMDKNYPFIAFGYLNFDEGRSFYKKSLAFCSQPDADVINTLYPMIIDGTYLSVFSPLVITGEESMGSDVMIPGSATTLINPEATVTPIRAAQDIKSGLEMLTKVESSLDETAQEMVMANNRRMTSYELSKMDAYNQMQLTPFVMMISSYVKQYGKLIISDIIQYLTLPEVSKIIDNGELVYKTVVLHDKKTASKKVDQNIKFDLSVSQEPMEPDEELGKSYDVLEEQGGKESKLEIARVNPKMFRNLKYQVVVTPDIITPRSEDTERAFGLEAFDKGIAAAQAGVQVDLETMFKDFILANYPKSQEDVDKYIIKQKPAQEGMPGQILGQPGQPGQPQQGPQGIPPQGMPQQGQPGPIQGNPNSLTPPGSRGQLLPRPKM